MTEEQITGEAAQRLPLAGVRVLDFTRVMSGPYCTMMLGDLGADVIKIERPGSGDDTRAWGPPFVEGEAAYFLSVNRNKRSVEVDLKSDRGREIIWRLIERSDVVAENFSPGTMDRLDFGHETVRERYPSIIYASVSGFGQTGPSKHRTAYDLIVQGMSGMMSVTGEPGGKPIKHGVPIADISAGMFAAFAIAAALYGREQTGEGTYIDVSMLGGQIAQLTYQATSMFVTGNVPGRLGNMHPIIVPYDTFPTMDGYVNICAGNDNLWRRTCQALELPCPQDDPRFTTNADRAANKPALYGLLNERLSELSTDDVVERLDHVGVPCGPILSVEEALSGDQADHLEFRQTVPHASLGSVEQAGFPYRFHGENPGIRHAPPTLGQHTAEILAELGIAAEET